jgi:competence protein ComEC
VTQRPAAFADDCRRASILIALIVSPKSCSAPKAVVDFFAARREGTHALYIEDEGRVRVETVARAGGAAACRPPRNYKQCARAAQHQGRGNTDPPDRDEGPLDPDQ